MRGLLSSSVGLCLLLCSLCESSSSQVYSPSKKVSEYHHYDLELNASYAQKLAIRPAVILVVGIVCFLLLVCWSICRCCKCCGCQRPTTKQDGPDNWRLFYTLFAIALTAGCIAMVIYGFKANSAQSVAFESVVDLVDVLIQWKTDTATAIANVQSSVQQLLANLATLTSLDSSDTYVSSSDKNTIQTACTNINTQSQTVLDAINGLNMDSIRSNVADNVKAVDKQRSMVVTSALVVLLVCSLLAIYFSLADSYFSKGCQPRRYLVCRVLSCLLALLTVLVVIIAWVVAAVLYAGSAGLADYCISPTDKAISLMSITADLPLYYLKCNISPMVFPYATQLASIQTSFTAAETTLTNAQNSVSSQPGCSGNSQCVAVNQTLADMRSNLQQLNVRIGVDTDGDGSYETGMLKQISCAVVNGIYQRFLNAFCADGFLAVASSFETFISFACFIVVAEFVRRKIPVSSMNAVAPSPQRVATPVKVLPPSKTPPLLPSGPALPAHAIVLPPLMHPGQPIAYDPSSGGAAYPFHAGMPFAQPGADFGEGEQPPGYTSSSQV